MLSISKCDILKIVMFLTLLDFVQLMIRGCPVGYVPAFDSSIGFPNMTGCQSSSDCPSGAECLISPVSSVYMCCRQDLSYLTTLPTIEDTEGTKGTVTDEPELTSAETPMETMAITEETEIPSALGNNTEAPITANSNTILVTLPDVLSRFPDVRQILVGRLAAIAGRPNVWQRFGSVTLIRDSGYNILVDTGSTRRQSEIQAALAQLGVNPSQIHMVILTHGHPDHFGGVHAYPTAQFLYGTYLYKSEEFFNYGLDTRQQAKLTNNIEIWSTPGHTADSVTVIVKNVPYGGIVAIVGDLVINEGDIEDSTIWANLSWNPSVQEENRNYVICRVDWIIPGHGKMFKVTNTTRAIVGCDTPDPSTGPPQLPQHMTYEEQNAIKYAYYTYTVSPLPSQSTVPSSTHSRSALFIMDDHWPITASAAYHGQFLSQFQRAFSLIPQPAVYPLDISRQQMVHQKTQTNLAVGGAGASACCVQPTKLQQRQPWQQITYMGQPVLGQSTGTANG